MTITRHGETDANINRILQGVNVGELTELGTSQAEKLGERLKDEKFDVIYCSDTIRTKQTASEVVKYHKNTPFYYTPDLRERDNRELVGKSYDEVSWADDNPGIETIDEIHDRAETFLKEILKKHPKDKVLIIAHGIINWCLIDAIKGKRTTLKEMFENDEKEMQKHTAVSVFEINEDKKHKIHYHNCTKHLEE